MQGNILPSVGIYICYDFLFGYFTEICKTYISGINHVNALVFDISHSNPRMQFTSHRSFKITRKLNKKLFCKNRLHTIKTTLQQLALELIKKWLCKNSFISSI